ncbi:hypothetical protein [Cupriavidus sp. UME77]|uniref:hypothetical protein n=1 Tax=Cupriavidus sp. UME77 TaxID=1862321 RepID=UPI0015FEE144|nr:hypothetical protein [Cupriavidus sp. UME77]
MRLNKGVKPAVPAYYGQFVSSTATTSGSVHPIQEKAKTWINLPALAGLSVFLKGLKLKPMAAKPPLSGRRFPLQKHLCGVASFWL